MTVRSRLTAAALFAPLALVAQPAAAQDAAATETVNMVIVYGNDTCPQSTADEIVVCARQSENERFRIPEDLRFDEDPSNQAWAKRVEKLEMVGAFGAMSCSPSGAGGFTGCTQQMIKDAYADKANGTAIRFTELVDKARAARAATIDADAAAEQARVEMIEKEYMDRLARESEAPITADTTPPPAPQASPKS